MIARMIATKLGTRIQFVSHAEGIVYKQWLTRHLPEMVEREQTLAKEFVKERDKLMQIGKPKAE